MPSRYNHKFNISLIITLHRYLPSDAISTKEKGGKQTTIFIRLILQTSVYRVFSLSISVYTSSIFYSLKFHMTISRALCYFIPTLVMLLSPLLTCIRNKISLSFDQFKKIRNKYESICWLWNEILHSPEVNCISKLSFTPLPDWPPICSTTSLFIRK